MTENQFTNPQSSETHSLLKSLSLHLFPGVCAGVACFVLLNPVKQMGYPSMMVLVLAALITIASIEWGIFLYEGKKRNQTWSLKGIVQYLNPIP